MKLFISIIFFITTCIAMPLSAQVYYYDKTGEAHQIHNTSEKHIIKAYLKEQKAKAIEFNPNLGSRFPFRLKNKKGNWVLYDLYEEQLLMEPEGNGYSFQLPTALMEHAGFTLASQKGKTYFVNIQYGGTLETKLAFDEVVVLPRKDTLYSYEQVVDEAGNSDYTEKEIFSTVIDKIAVRNNKAWGLIELTGTDFFYLSRNFLYSSPQEVPGETGFQSYQLKMMEDIRKEYGVDLLVALDEFGYYLKGRHKKTGQWGVFMGEGEVNAAISPKYDSIVYHQGPIVYEVWKNNKVGYYNGDCNLVFEPQFDAFEYVHLDYRKGCAVKSNGSWTLYDTYGPEKIIDPTANTVAELLDAWWNR